MSRLYVCALPSASAPATSSLARRGLGRATCAQLAHVSAAATVALLADRAGERSLPLPIRISAPAGLWSGAPTRATHVAHFPRFRRSDVEKLRSLRVRRHVAPSANQPRGRRQERGPKPRLPAGAALQVHCSFRNVQPQWTFKRPGDRQEASSALWRHIVPSAPPIVPPPPPFWKEEKINWWWMRRLAGWRSQAGQPAPARPGLRARGPPPSFAPPATCSEPEICPFKAAGWLAGWSL